MAVKIKGLVLNKSPKISKELCKYSKHGSVQFLLSSLISLFCLVGIPMYVTVWFFIGRQTSDPKSGFATVEKDLPGGLTPMLGDRKVIQGVFKLL